MKNNRFVRQVLLLLLVLQSLYLYSRAQMDNQWSEDIRKLKASASIMFIGVSPEDYNKQQTQYFLKKDLYRVGFLSLTRGENSDIDSLANALQGVQRGIYNVNKSITKISQYYSDLYFTRAYDFLSNEREDSASIFEKLWDLQSIIGDVVWNIRTFRPDVIVFPSYSHLPKKGKRFYSLQMIKDAIRIAGDSTFFKEQFDDNRYPWKAALVIMSDSLHGKYSLKITDSLHLQYDIVSGHLPKNSMMENVQQTWHRIYQGLDSDFFQKYLDSIQLLNLSQKQQASALLNLRNRLDTASFRDSYWRMYKDDQLNEMILKYAGIKASVNFSQPFLVLGKPYSYTIHYEGDTSIAKLNYVKFGRFDTTFDNFTGMLSIEKQFTFDSKETPYQPYWMTATMSTPGMYEIGSRNNLNSPTNYNPFSCSFIFLMNGTRYKYFIPAYFIKPTDSVKETPVITIPGFSDIAPGIILPHLNANRKSEKVFVRLQPNFTQKQVPITINLVRKGLLIKRGKDFSGGNKKLVLQTKDSIADLVNGKGLFWTFDISQKVLDSLDGDIGAEIWIGREPHKLKINSSLMHIPLAGMQDIDYHYQPGIGLLNKDTFTVQQKKTIALLTDSSNILALENVKMILGSLHADYKMVNVNTIGWEDSLQQFGQLLLSSSFAKEKDSAISQYTENGGTLIVLPFSNDSLPSFVGDSISVQKNNLLLPQADVFVDIEDSLPLFSFPNKIRIDQFPENGTISTINWNLSNLKQSNIIPIQYKTRQSDSITPLIGFRYGKGRIILNAFFMDAASLEQPFTYKLWANLLNQ